MLFCKPMVVWGITTTYSSTCSAVQHCVSLPSSQPPQHVCSCSSSSLLLKSTSSELSCETSRASWALAGVWVCLAMLCLPVVTRFVFAARASRRRTIIIRDAIFAGLCACILFVVTCLVRAVRLAVVANNSAERVLEYILLVSTGLLFFSQCVVAVIYGVALLFSLQNIHHMIHLNLSSTQALRATMRRYAISFAFAATVAAGIPFLNHLAGLAYIINSTFVAALAILYFYTLKHVFSVSELPSADHHPIFHLLESLVLITLSICLFVGFGIANGMLWMSVYQASATGSFREGIATCEILQMCCIPLFLYSVAVAFSGVATLPTPAIIRRESQKRAVVNTSAQEITIGPDSPVGSKFVVSSVV